MLLVLAFILFLEVELQENPTDKPSTGEQLIFDPVSSQSNCEPPQGLDHYLSIPNLYHDLEALNLPQSGDVFSPPNQLEQQNIGLLGALAEPLWILSRIDGSEIYDTHQQRFEVGSRELVSRTGMPVPLTHPEGQPFEAFRFSHYRDHNSSGRFSSYGLMGPTPRNSSGSSFFPLLGVTGFGSNREATPLFQYSIRGDSARAIANDMYLIFYGSLVYPFRAYSSNRVSLMRTYEEKYLIFRPQCVIFASITEHATEVYGTYIVEY